VAHLSCEASTSTAIGAAGATSSTEAGKAGQAQDPRATKVSRDILMDSDGRDAGEAWVEWLGVQTDMMLHCERNTRVTTTGRQAATLNLLLTNNRDKAAVCACHTNPVACLATADDAAHRQRDQGHSSSCGSGGLSLQLPGGGRVVLAPDQAPGPDEVGCELSLCVCWGPEVEGICEVHASLLARLMQVAMS
jgi:hypothetical protein